MQHKLHNYKLFPSYCSYKPYERKFKKSYIDKALLDSLNEFLSIFSTNCTNQLIDFSLSTICTEFLHDTFFSNIIFYQQYQYLTKCRLRKNVSMGKLQNGVNIYIFFQHLQREKQGLNFVFDKHYPLHNSCTLQKMIWFIRYFFGVFILTNN